MQKRDTTIIAVRLLALYVIIIMAVNPLLSYFSMIGFVNTGTDPMSRAVVLSGIIAGVLYLTIGIGLWLYSTSLANLITRDLSETTQSTEEFTLEGIQVVAVSIVGLIVLSSAIPALFKLIVSSQFPGTNPKYVRTIDAMGKMKAEIPVVDLVKVIVEMGLGFWFLLGSNGIVNAIRIFWAKGNK